MRDDAPLPDIVPVKRRQIERALDRHIAIWLAGDGLTPSQRRHLEEERARRKALVPERPVGLVVGGEGLTPHQLTAVVELLRSSRATEVVHTRVPRRTHGTLLALRDEMTLRLTLVGSSRETVRNCSLVIAAPRSAEISEATEVSEMIRYAKHRNLPVKVVLPDGRIQQ